MLTTRPGGSVQDLGVPPLSWTRLRDSAAVPNHTTYDTLQYGWHTRVPLLDSRWRNQGEKPSSRGLAAVRTYQQLSPPTSWLADALQALAEVPEEIAEDELPSINSAALEEAERIVRGLARHPQPPTVYPTQDAEIAIHFKATDSPSAVVILLNDSGEAECYAHADGRSRHAHYGVSADLPDDFVMAQLRALAPRRHASTVWSVGFGTSNILVLSNPWNAP
jgi:hypothetical protein